MPTDFQLINVVAFDERGSPVLEPPKNWKVSYNPRTASIEIKAKNYSRRYSLRSEVAAIGTGDSRKKVALGKTLGRVALTGLLHGRYAAGADLRWGGVSRDEFVELYLMFSDTTAITMELEGDEFDEFIAPIPESAKADDAQQRMEKLVARISAMVDDGPRVLTEVNATRIALEAELQQQQPLVDGGATFDDRYAARGRVGELTQTLAQLGVVRNAVTYDLAVAGVAIPTVPQATQTAPLSIAAARLNAPITTGTKQSAPALPPVKKKTSFLGRLVKLVVAIIGAGVGFVVGLYLTGLFGHSVILIAIPVCIIVGAWLSVQMLNALMRR